MSDLSRGLKSLHDAEDDYEEAKDYYEGTVEEFFSNPKIAKALEKAKSRFRLNFAAIPVDKRVDRMRPGAITVPKNDTLTAILKEKFWDANDFDDDLDGWLRQCAYFGDYYLLLWPGESTGEDDEKPQTVEVFGNSPLVMRAIYSRENARKMLFVIKEWTVTLKDGDGNEAERVRVNLYYPNRIERYISKVGIASPGDDDSNFEPFIPTPAEGDEPEDSDIENPYGVIPVFHLRFGGSRPYGTPVHKVCYGAQDAINKITMTHLSTIDFQGFPQRFALLDAATSAADDDAGEYFGDDDGTGESAQSNATAKKSRLKGGAGEVWWLDGVKEVGQFDAAGHEPFLEPAKFYVRSMGTLSNTPLYEFDLEGATPPSGEARRRADGPINADVKKASSVIGQVLENAAAFALVILGHGEEKVELAWLPTDDATDADDVSLIASKTTAGVPLRQALLEAGYAEEQIDEWWPENGANVSLGDLLSLSQAIAALGQATTLGSITAGDVARIVPPGILQEGERESVTPPKPKAPVPAPPPEPAPVA